jgi:hypothetical protein
MRTSHLLLAAILACATPAWAGEPDAALATTEALSQASDDAGAPRSGFGQVMGVLTHLLQDAAERELGRREPGLVLENPALQISVTPVEGETSFVRGTTRKADAMATRTQPVATAAMTP